MLYEPPFTDLNDQGISGVFDNDSDLIKVVKIIDHEPVHCGPFAKEACTSFSHYSFTRVPSLRIRQLPIATAC